MTNTAPFKITLFLFMLLLAQYCVAGSENRLKKGYITLSDKTAPIFSLKDLNGEVLNSKTLKNNWVFLHFWASWCRPCRKELPAIQLLINKNSLKSFKFVLINTAETEETVFEFFAQLNLDMPVLLDETGEVTELFKPRGLPSTFIIDPQGKLRYLFFGGRPWNSKAYRQFLQSLESENPDNKKSGNTKINH